MTLSSRIGLVLPAILAATVCGVTSLTGCTTHKTVVSSTTVVAPSGALSPPPAELVKACGHQGLVVTLHTTKLPVRISRSACDLRGVTIRWRSGSDTVPGGERLGPPTTCTGDGSECPSISVNARTGDVTIGVG